MLGALPRKFVLLVLVDMIEANSYEYEDETRIRVREFALETKDVGKCVSCAVDSTSSNPMGANPVSSSQALTTMT